MEQQFTIFDFTKQQHQVYGFMFLCYDEFYALLIC